MMYGPMAVADHASGKDLARKLLEGMVPIAQQRADARIISFVDNANSASIAVHRRVGLSSLTEFEFEGRPLHFVLTQRLGTNNMEKEDPHVFTYRTRRL